MTQKIETKTDFPVEENLQPKNTPICGILMPISDIGDCSATHWKDVRTIIEEAASDAGYKANLVSESDDVGVIQKRIVENLYENEIVVCDVSAKNANVMFELGLRLAFDKPAIVLKDNMTSYSFDTSPIEHLEYPRDLRYSTIQTFKSDLANKIKATAKAAEKPDHTTFLKHFGKFEVAGLETQKVSELVFLQAELKEIRNSLSSMMTAVRSIQIESEAPGRYRSINRKSVGRNFSDLRETLTRAVAKGEIHKNELVINSPKLYRFLDPMHRDRFESGPAFMTAVDDVVNSIISSGDPGTNPFAA